MSFAKKIFKNLTKFQIACVPGHRACEHLYVLKSMFAHYEKQKKGLILTGYDVKTFYDAEDPYDVLNELYKSEVRGKIYRLVFEMNKNSKVKIKTPVGTTETKDTGPIVLQESVDAPILSANNIGNGVNEVFKDEEKEVEFVNDIRLAPLTFMDDISAVRR